MRGLFSALHATDRSRRSHAALASAIAIVGWQLRPADAWGQSYSLWVNPASGSWGQISNWSGPIPGLGGGAYFGTAASLRSRNGLSTLGHLRNTPENWRFSGLGARAAAAAKRSAAPPQKGWPGCWPVVMLWRLGRGNV